MNQQQAEVLEYLVEENCVLKEQLKGRALRLTDDQRRRLAAKSKKIGRRLLMQVATIVTPDTILRWHRQLIAAKWTYKTSRVGRPGLMKKIKEVIVRMALENSSWGYCRIQGELYVLFVIDLKSRRVHLARITRNPNESFMAHVASDLTDCFDGFLRDHRFLILDRDSKFTELFKGTLRSAGVEPIPTCYQAPNCNAFAERFVLSIKSECLGRMIFFGEASLRRACSAFVEHFHAERSPQGLGNEPIEASDWGRAKSGAQSGWEGSSNTTRERGEQS